MSYGAETFVVNGVEQFLCSKHKLEFCDPCIVDFRDINKNLRDDAKIEQLIACNASGCVTEATMKCARCEIARYCSRECQKKHWKAGHKQECVKAEEKFFQFRKTKQRVKVHGIGTVCKLKRENIEELREEGTNFTEEELCCKIMGYDENGGNSEELVRMTSLDEADPPEYLICYLSTPTQKEWMTCEAFHEKYTDVIETY